MQSKPAFREDPFPDGCPPDDAKPFVSQTILRLVGDDPCVQDDFRSRHAESAPEPAEPYDKCRFRACSVFVGKKGKLRANGIAKLPAFKGKFKYIAHIKVDENSGVAKPWPDKVHISFWMFAAFDVLAAVEKLEPVL